MDLNLLRCQLKCSICDSVMLKPERLRLVDPKVLVELSLLIQVRLLTKANHDLTAVQHRLDKEFQQIYPQMKLVSRIKKIQQDLSTLEDQCRQLLTAKQDLIDKARTTLVGNRNLVQRMEASMGIFPNTDSDDSAFANFNQCWYSLRSAPSVA